MRETLIWPEWALEVLENFYALEGGASVRARLARRGLHVSEFSVRHKASRLDLGADMLEFTPAAEVAREANVTPQAVHGWLNRTTYRRHCRTWGAELLIPLPAVRLYLGTTIPRAAARPKGWLPLKAAAELRGVDPRTLYDDAVRGRVPAVRVGKDVFIEPTSARQPGPQHRPAPPALYPVGRLSVAAGLHRDLARQFFERAGVPMPRFAHPLHAHLSANYVSADHARQFLSARGHHDEQVETLLRRALQQTAKVSETDKGEG